MTEIKNFDTITAATVVEANEKLYINRDEGFIGTGLKKDEFVCNCSDIDDVIIFYKDGTYKIVRIAEKLFIGETERSKAEKKKAEVIHVAIFKKNDARTIYNVIYRDGKSGISYIKRFNVTSMTRDREYDLTQGTPKSKVLYFTSNPNGEAEVVKVTLKLNPKLKRVFFDKDFSEVGIKGRQSMGNILTKLEVSRVTLKNHGGSTLGGRKVWFDQDVKRLNYDQQGIYLGEFSNEDQILVVLTNGEFYLTGFDSNNHYEDNILRIEKFDANKVWTAALFDHDKDGFLYVKRFQMEASARHQNCVGENPQNQLLLLTDTPYPHLKVIMGGTDDFREPIELDAETFIGVKGFKARGKRVTTFHIAKVEELEPLRRPEPEISDPTEGEDSGEEPAPDTTTEETELDPDAGKVAIEQEQSELTHSAEHEQARTKSKSQQDVADEMTGQLHLFD